MRIHCVFLILLVGSIVKGQTFSGRLTDLRNGEALIQATIYQPRTGAVEYTDAFGNFSIDVQVDVADTLVFSYLGYTDSILVIRKSIPQFANIRLIPNNKLETVVIKGKKKVQPGKYTLTVNELKDIPTLGAMNDVVKALQVLPGVNASQEGKSDLTVRGGDPGQNRYLIDDVPLIYINHLGGLFSVFNTDMINSVDFYKDVFPSKYSGALSSVLSIQQKEGNFQKWRGTFQVGLLILSGSVEGPLTKNISLMVTARKTLSDYLMLGVSSISDQSFLVSYGFHDFNAKVTYRLNEKHRFFLNAYSGDDYLKYRNKKDIMQVAHFKQLHKWGNAMVAGRYQGVLSSRLSAHAILGWTKYRLLEDKRYQFSGDELKWDVNQNDISDILLKSDWKYFVNNRNEIAFGMQHTKSVTSTSSKTHEDSEGGNIKQNTWKNNAYVEYNYSRKIGLNATLGFHGKRFQHEDYQFYGLEPRVRIGWNAKNWNIYMGYMKAFQENHLISNSSGIIPNELWVSSTSSIPVSSSNMISMTTQYEWKRLSVGLSVYYKKYQDLIMLPDGYTTVFGDDKWEDILLKNGKGEAYGVEVESSYQKGDWKLSGSYAYARSFRLFEEVNHGRIFPFAYDRPHQFKLLGTYIFNAHWSVSGYFQFTTGIPYTPVIGKYLSEVENEPGSYYEVVQYGEKNSSNLGDYHRLDLSATYTYRTKKRGRKAEWIFSIYNVYGRQNAFQYYVSTDASSTIKNPVIAEEYYKPADLGLYQLTSFPFIPSFSYKIYFGTETKDKPKRIDADSKENTKKNKSGFREWFFQE